LHKPPSKWRYRPIPFHRIPRFPGIESTHSAVPRVELLGTGVHRGPPLRLYKPHAPPGAVNDHNRNQFGHTGRTNCGGWCGTVNLGGDGGGGACQDPVVIRSVVLLSGCCGQTDDLVPDGETGDHLTAVLLGALKRKQREPSTSTGRHQRVFPRSRRPARVPDGCQVNFGHDLLAKNTRCGGHVR
jgi:hypothetical protein